MAKLNSKILFTLIFTALVILRFSNLGKIPIFGDESVHLYLADKIIHNPSSLFDSIKFGVFPIAIWIQAFFQFTFGSFLNPLIIGRSVTVSSDLLSAFLLFKISQNFLNKTSTIVVPIIYLLLPLNFLESRLALLESFANLFLTLALYFTVKLAASKEQKGKINNFIFASGFLVVSFFTKPLALAAFPAITLFPVFQNKTGLKKSLFSTFLVLFTVSAVILLFYLPTSSNFSRYIVNKQPLTQLLSHFKLNLWRFFWWSTTYITIPILLATTLGCLSFFIKKDRKTLWLFFYLVSITVIECLFGLNFYPRHLYLLAAPVSLLLGYTFNQIYLLRKKLSILLLLAVLILPLRLDFQIITSPQTAPIALEDKLQLFEDWSSGVGDDEVVNKINQLSQNQKITLYVEDESSQTWVFQNLYHLNNTQIIPSNNLLLGQFIEPQLLLQGVGQKYYLLNKTQSKSDSWPGKLIFTVNKGPNRSMNLYSL